MSFARRHEEPVAVVMLDIDDFSKVNDTDGQAGGDAMLRSMAKLVRKNARSEDVVARYGADQMVVLMRRTTLEQASVFGERICEAVRKAAFDVGDVPIRASVSIGVASFEPGRLDIADNQQLLDGADTAMYEAKSGGKDRVAMWSRTAPADAESAADEPEPG
jgi:diguanylate cyclase (GGDEF)-like protein